MTISFPTVLSPWYSIVKIDYDSSIEPVEFFAVDDAGTEYWTTNKKEASLFLSLHSALRIAKLENAEVLLVWNQEKLKEYREE